MSMNRPYERADNGPTWPPYPTVVLSARKWRQVVRALRRDGTKQAAALGDAIEAAIDAQADRIVRRAAAAAPAADRETER